MRMRVALSVSFLLLAAFALAQQSAQQPMVANAEDARFVTTPGAPDCATYSVLHGDVKGSSSVTLIKFAPGCTMPVHWHSANEQITMVSGSGVLQPSGEQPHTVNSGAYFYMPAHHVHQLACAGGCTFYRSLDGPSDLHFVDAAGNEIPAEKALAAVGERPATAVAQK